MSRLLLDTNAAVSVLEGEPTAPKVWAVFQAARRMGAQVIVSPLTLAEVLSRRGLSPRELARREDFCLSTEGIEFGPVAFDAAFARRVAGRRQRAYPQKLPDCVQHACAEVLECDAILSADARFVRQCPVKGLLTCDINA